MEADQQADVAALLSYCPWRQLRSLRMKLSQGRYFAIPEEFLGRDREILSS